MSANYFVGIGTSDPQYTLHVNGDFETTNLNIAGIAEWVGTVYTVDNIWNVSTVKNSRITPSSITNIGIGQFQIAFSGAALPTKTIDTGLIMSEGNRRYFISGTSDAGTTLVNRAAAWPENTITYAIRTLANNASINVVHRLRVTVLLE